VACIAIVTLHGRARFAVHAGPGREEVVDEWVTGAGEVILLRGWAPTCDADPRPYHRVDAPDTGPRLMFQLRHNLAANMPPSAWLSGLTAAEINQATSLATTPEAPRR
jgi:hypothetical protein